MASEKQVHIERASEEQLKTLDLCNTIKGKKERRSCVQKAKNQIYKLLQEEKRNMSKTGKKNYKEVTEKRNASIGRNAQDYKNAERRRVVKK